MKQFSGLGVAMVTPFNASGDVDESGLRKLTNFLIDGGVDFLVVLGTTGESATLTSDEKKRVLDTVMDENSGRLPIVYGVGGNDTRVVTTNLTAIPAGVDGILSVSPYYNKPTQEGIFQHYKVVSESTDLPIILYNVPGRTGSNVLADTTLRVADECKNIVAVKEASGNLEQVMHIIANRPQGFNVLSGDDALTLPMMAAGAEGVISVVGNAYPELFSKMVHCIAQGEWDIARAAHYTLLEPINAMFAEGNPGGVKEFLALKQVCGTRLRLPLVNVSDGLKNKIALLDLQVSEQVAAM
ncbi:MAG: 4-hydroxy-tetrahydrodipicolinate synthase [Flavobacteriales bacterium]|nr:4-hydroxy-tetrahydrodipicolinate synthase [Flavobacteriales bacterium]